MYWLLLPPEILLIIIFGHTLGRAEADFGNNAVRAWYYGFFPGLLTIAIVLTVTLLRRRAGLSPWPLIGIIISAPFRSLLCWAAVVVYFRVIIRGASIRFYLRWLTSGRYPGILYDEMIRRSMIVEFTMAAACVAAGLLIARLRFVDGRWETIVPIKRPR